jgi:hypothetical protein
MFGLSNHGDIEDTEEAQSRMRSYPAKSTCEICG